MFLSLYELNEKVNNLLQTDALELAYASGLRTTIYIPYMMNDAVEYYFTLEGCTVTGELPEGEEGAFPEGSVAEVFPAGQQTGAGFHVEELDEEEKLRVMSAGTISIRNGYEGLLRIDFTQCSKTENFYQYHRTGHYWIEEQGHFRRLVYLIGTIYDKIEYLGPEAGNVKEKSIKNLMEFAPFRYWSPINESLDHWYHDFSDGHKTMRAIALEAGDRYYAFLCKIYSEWHPGFLKRYMAKYLVSDSGQKIYELLLDKLEECSMEYHRRDYGQEVETSLTIRRMAVDQNLRDRGYQGTYPNYFKIEAGESEPSKEILVIEEQPYVRSELDFEGFTYAFHYEYTHRDGGHIGHNIIHVEEL